MLYKFDIICLSETYLDSGTPIDDENLEISGYTLVRSNHASNTKRWSLCLYYKNNLPLRVTNIGYLNKCLTLELKIGDKTCNFIVVYRPTSETQMKLKLFLTILKWLWIFWPKNNPFLMVTMGLFSAKWKNWYSQDKTSFDGKTIESITSQFSLYQLVN